MFESPLKQHQNRWIDRFYVKMVYFFALAQKSIWSNSRWLLCLRGGEEVQIDHKPPVKQSRPLFPFCPLNSMHVYCFILWIFPFAHGEHPLVWMKTVQMKQRKKLTLGEKGRLLWIRTFLLKYSHSQKHFALISTFSFYSSKESGVIYFFPIRSWAKQKTNQNETSMRNAKN